jgi:hypothetical protein
MRQGARSGPEELDGMRGHCVAALDLLVVQGARTRGSRVVPHLLEGPRKVDCSGTRSEEQRRGFIDVLPTLRCERESVRRGDADGRCAPNRQLANRAGDLRDRPALELDLFVGQPALVEEDDPRAILLVPNDLLGF